MDNSKEYCTQSLAVLMNQEKQNRKRIVPIVRCDVSGQQSPLTAGEISIQEETFVSEIVG